MYLCGEKRLITGRYARLFVTVGKLTGVPSAARHIACVGTLELYTQLPGLLTVSWSPDGRSLVTGSSDNSVNIWRVSEEFFTLSQRLQEHSRNVRSVSWSPDGSALAAGGKEECVKIWGVRGEEQVGSEVSTYDFGMARTIHASASSLW
eukprot:1269665-Amorphochlora_amoeboformis.AAC.3